MMYDGDRRQQRSMTARHQATAALSGAVALKQNSSDETMAAMAWRALV